MGSNLQMPHAFPKWQLRFLMTGALPSTFTGPKSLCCRAVEFNRPPQILRRRGFHLQVLAFCAYNFRSSSPLAGPTPNPQRPSTIVAHTAIPMLVYMRCVHMYQHIYIYTDIYIYVYSISCLFVFISSYIHICIYVNISLVPSLQGHRKIEPWPTQSSVC